MSSHTVKNAGHGLNARLYAEEIKGHVEDDPRVAYDALSGKEQQRLAVMYLRALSIHDRMELILWPLFEDGTYKRVNRSSLVVDYIVDYIVADESKDWRHRLYHWAGVIAQNCEDAVQRDLEAEKWRQMEPDSSLDPERLLFDRHEAEAINRGSR